MSFAVDKINSLRLALDDRASKLAAGDPLRKRLADASSQVDELRRKIVATKEGGAITGEERLREHLDTAWGGVTFTEERPTPYHLERVNVLERELKEVEDEFAQLMATQVAALNQAFATRQIAAIDPLVF